MSTLLNLKFEYAAIPGGPINRSLLFTGDYLAETVDVGPLESRIPVASSGGIDGDFDEEGRDESRLITITGTLHGSCAAGDPVADVRTKSDALGRALLRGQRGYLWRYSDRYFKCQLKTRRIEDGDGSDIRAWSAVFRASDPYLWDSIEQPIAFLPTANGTYNIDTQCSAPAWPTFTVNVATIGTLTLTHAGLSMSFSPPVAGLYIIDCETGRATGPTGGILGASGDATIYMGGSWIQLYPSATTIGVEYTGGLTVVDTTLRYTRRFTD